MKLIDKSILKIKQAAAWTKSQILAGVVEASLYEESGLQLLDGPLKDGVATTFNYAILFTYQANGKSDSSSWLLADAVVGFNNPDNGYEFSNSPETGYKVVALVRELAPMVIRYWDNANLDITRKLTEMYEEQLNEEGLLRIGYNNKQLTVFDNGRKFTLHRCAISRPHYDDCSSSNQLKMFSVTVSYEDYTDEFVK